MGGHYGWATEEGITGGPHGRALREGHMGGHYGRATWEAAEWAGGSAEGQREVSEAAKSLAVSAVLICHGTSCEVPHSHYVHDTPQLTSPGGLLLL
jgi:hypothetical protein